MSGQMGDILRQLAREYIVETAEFIEQMAKKLEFGEVDLEEIQKVAHKLKGSGATYGFDKISEIAAKVEAAAKSGQEKEAKKLFAELVEVIRMERGNLDK